MADFTRAAATAKRLIEANGREVTLVRKNAAPADAAKPFDGPAQAPASGDGFSRKVRAAFVPIGSAGGLGFTSTVDQKLMREVTEIALIASDSAPGVALESATLVIDEGNEYRVAVGRRLKPAGKSVMVALGVVR